MRAPIPVVDQSRLTTSPHRFDKVRGWAVSHPILLVFGAAFVVRAFVAAGLHVAGLQIQPDEAAFWRLAGDLQQGTTGDWTNYESFLFRASRSLVVPLSLVRALPGPSELYARLLIALAGAGTAGVATKMALLLGSRTAGLIAGGLVAFWPSQILFSTFIHRDALVWLGIALLGLVALMAYRARSSGQLALLGLAAIALFFMLFTLRPAIGTLAGVALVVASLFLPLRVRAVATAGSMVAVLAIPLVLGFGLAGADIVGSDKFVEPKDLPPIAAGEPETGADRLTDEGSTEGADAIACTRIVRPYPPTDPGRIALRTIRGIAPVMFGPMPWRPVCSLWGSLAKVEAIVWGVLVLFALFGLVRSAIRRSLPYRQLAFALFFGGGLWVAMAYFERTVGTAFRHRQQLFWVVAVIMAHLYYEHQVRGGSTSVDPV